MLIFKQLKEVSVLRKYVSLYIRVYKNRKNLCNLTELRRQLM